MREHSLAETMGWRDQLGPERLAGAVLGPAFVWYFAWMLPMAVSSQLVAFIPDFDPDLYFCIWIALDLLTMAALVTIMATRHRAECVVFVRPRPRTVELCMFLAAVGALVLYSWGRCLHGLADFAWPLYEFGGAWLLVAMLVVVPMFGEELLFRGLLLQRFRRVFPLWGALALQAGLFSMAHQGPQWLWAFAAGLVFGLLRVAADALWPAILMHGAWNGAIALEVLRA